MYDTLLETLVDLVGRNRSADMIDSTEIRVHHCTIVITKVLALVDALGRLQRGLTIQLHARCLLLAFILKPR
ncbi:hypothetical protein GCM10010937_00720 [Gluconobacter japonicus]|uniref:Transposase n=1 Tax=Gluconobacter japonicus TaxID=376620 RepID=A0ABQ5WEQ8_GLUJA|nr:hypothetical protein GCM10010937_00720 [Gluconobacter japonicus]